MNELLKYYDLCQRLKTAKGKFTRSDLQRAVNKQEKKCRKLGVM